MTLDATAGPLAVLELDTRTMFVLDANGRILRENDPDRSPGPRVFIAGCPAGNLVRVRADVPDAAEIERIVASAPPWFDALQPPPWLDRASASLGPVTVTASLIYALPRHAVQPAPMLVYSDTGKGAALIARLARDGMPAPLADAGFLSVADFWPPWCAVIQGQQIAAMAFAARLGPEGAEAGVYTFPAFRGRGLAGQATAAWSAMPELASRTLFYSTTVDNLSSRRVAARLGLRQIGSGLRLS